MLWMRAEADLVMGLLGFLVMGVLGFLGMMILFLSDVCEVKGRSESWDWM